MNCKDYMNGDFFKDKDIFYATLGGSHSYGTNIETSDVDIRGICFNTKNSLIGIEPDFEQYEHPEEDTVLFSFKKFIKLLIDNNPNILELVGTRKEDCYCAHPLAEELREKRRMFISKKSVYKFNGYANAQLRRLQATLARDYPKAEKEEHILQSVTHALAVMEESFKGGVKPYITEEEIKVDVDIKGMPLRDFRANINAMTSIINEYDKINSRNKKKDDLHLNKHIMHLCRLKYTLLDILKEYDIITYRPERDFLLQIRNGLFVTEDRKIVPTFYDWLEEIDCKIEEALEKTLVPDEPDFKGIQDFVIKVNNFTLERSKVTLG